MADGVQERMKEVQERLSSYIDDRARTLARMSDGEYLRNIERGISIVAPEQMSKTVYKLYARLVLMQYYSEYWGAYQYERAFRMDFAPREKSAPQIFERMYQEEYGHARLVWFGDGKGNPGPLTVLKIDPMLFLADGPQVQVNVLHIFRHPGFMRWSEIIIYNHFQDRSAALQLRDFANGPFEPWTKVLEIIDGEEADHIRHGEEWFTRIAASDEGQKMLQEDINKWFPHAMDVFGHPGETSKTMEALLRLGVKRKTNDQAREDFLQEVNPLIRQAGLELPPWQHQEQRSFEQ